MAKKGGAPLATTASNQPIVEETTVSETPPSDVRVVENLKELNGRLLKETMSSRVEVSQLLTTLENSAASEVEGAVCHVVLAESFKEEAATVAEKSEEIERHIREKTETATSLDELRKDFERLRSEKESVEAALNLACKERDDCRRELGQFQIAAMEEIESLNVDLNGLVTEKAENAKCLEALRMDFDRLMSEKVSVEKGYELARKERDVSREEFRQLRENSEGEIRSMKVLLEGMEKCNDDLEEFARMMKEKEITEKDLAIALSKRDSIRGEFEANERKLEALANQNTMVLDELEKKVSEVDFKNGEIQRIRDEPRFVVQSFEDFSRGACEAQNRLQSLTEELKSEISLLKKIGSEKDVKINSLDRKNAEHLEEISRLNAALDQKMNEHHSLKTLTTQRIAELDGKLLLSAKSLKSAEEGKAKLMSNITQLENQIGLLKTEEKSKASIISDLEKDISRLNEELEAKTKYCVDMAEQQKQKEKQLEESKDVMEKELEEVKACATVLSENTLSALKETVMLVVNSSDHQQMTIKELPKSVELTDDSIKSFLAGFVSVNKAISSKTKEMESVKQELMLLKKKSLWAWMSSAATVFAAVAFILKGR